MVSALIECNRNVFVIVAGFQCILLFSKELKSVFTWYTINQNPRYNILTLFLNVFNYIFHIFELLIVSVR